MNALELGTYIYLIHLLIHGNFIISSQCCLISSFEKRIMSSPTHLDEDRFLLEAESIVTNLTVNFAKAWHIKHEVWHLQSIFGTKILTKNCFEKTILKFGFQNNQKISVSYKLAPEYRFKYFCTSVRKDQTFLICTAGELSYS